jgi:hypothetical protein
VNIIFTLSTCCRPNILFDSLRNGPGFLRLEDMDATEVVTRSLYRCVNRPGKRRSSDIVHIFHIYTPTQKDVLQVAFTQAICTIVSSFRVWLLLANQTIELIITLILAGL